MTDTAVACAEVVRSSRSNFALAFRFLPRRQRVAMNAVYAFCRRTDDIVDGPGDLDAKRAALVDWRAQLDVGGPDPILHAVLAAAEEFDLQRTHLHAVIDGCEMDLAQARFADFDELTVYTRRVAAAVGSLCLGVWGVRGERGDRFADDLGHAVQLTNIVRDVGDDAALGRIYIPQCLMRSHAVAEEDVLARRMSAGLRSCLAELAAVAHHHYRIADVNQFVPEVRRRLWPARIIARTYQALLSEIERRDFPVFTERVRLSGARKTTIALAEMARRLVP